MEPRKIVLSPAWCSKLRLTTGVKILALSHGEFRGPRSDFVRQVLCRVQVSKWKGKKAKNRICEKYHSECVAHNFVGKSVR
ncbi:hypothetical protein TNCV_1893071 [Trichonephila clavipes]|nr:hypothetical protein TNCV_1893071 [Trichonephila clavipes]